MSPQNPEQKPQTTLLERAENESMMPVWFDEGSPLSAIPSSLCKGLR